MYTSCIKCSTVWCFNCNKIGSCGTCGHCNSTCSCPICPDCSKGTPCTAI